MLRMIRVLPVLLCLSLVPAPGQADVLPPDGCGGVKDTAPCDGKKAGDACTFSNGNAGKCAALRCTNDAGQALLQCVATGAESGGCSAAAGGAPLAPGGLLVLLATGLLALRRRVSA